MVTTVPGHEDDQHELHAQELLRPGFDAAVTEPTRPHAVAAVQLRRWDDLAKTPGQRTPPLGYYLGLLDSLLSREPSGARPDWHLLDAA